MEDKKFSKKLNDYFKDNIKLSYVTKDDILIVTKDDMFYKFERNLTLNENKNSLIAWIENTSTVKSLIEKSIVKKLCNLNIIDISKCFRHIIVRTKDGKIYQYYKYPYNENNRSFNKTLKSQLINTESSEINEFTVNKPIIDFCCGYNHTIALTTDDKLFAWIDNSTRQFPGSIGLIKITGDISKTFELKEFTSDKVKYIACTSMQSLILTKNGSVYEWGHTYYEPTSLGILQYWKRLTTYKPIRLNINVIFEKISCGRNHSLLLSKNKFIYSYGDNNFGQLGSGNFENNLNPEKVLINEEFIDIASNCHFNISVALSIYGEYYVWGECKDQKINKPIKTNFKSFDDIFEYYCDITYKAVENKIITFNDKNVKNVHFIKNFINAEKLGEGSYGQVFKVKDKRNNHYFALKLINFKHSEEKIFINELNNSVVLNLLFNKNVVQYYDVWIENNSFDFNNIFTLYIQMELCEYSLRDIINEINGNVMLKDNEFLSLIGYNIATNIFIQIFEGMNYLHKLIPQIIHRDLKPDNILINIENVRNITAKIADFGLMTFHKCTEDTEDKSIGRDHTEDVGALNYAAPEKCDGPDYDTKSDVYSLGVIFGEIFNIEANRNICKNNKIFDKYNEAIKLYDEMIKDNPEERPSCEDILKNTQLWALIEKDFDSENVFKSFISSETNNKSIFIKSKEKEDFDIKYSYLASLWTPEDTEYFPSIPNNITNIEKVQQKLYPSSVRRVNDHILYIPEGGSIRITPHSNK